MCDLLFYFFFDYDVPLPIYNDENTHVPFSRILKYQDTANDAIITEIQEEATLLKKAKTVMEHFTPTRKLYYYDCIKNTGLSLL